MTLEKWGLLYNFLGAILLGLHILDEKLLNSIETKSKNFPGNVSQVIFIGVLGPMLKTMIKRQRRNWPGGSKRWLTEFQKYLNLKLKIGDSQIYSMKWPRLQGDPFGLLFVEGIFMSLIISDILWISVCPLLLPITTIIFIFSKTQKLLRLKSIFGLLGVVFLVVGFILHFFS
jgi:hypothetical protein